MRTDAASTALVGSSSSWWFVVTMNQAVGLIWEVAASMTSLLVVGGVVLTGLGVLRRV